MAKKNKLTLSSVLESFEESLNKTATKTEKEQTSEQKADTGAQAKLDDRVDAVEKEEVKEKAKSGDTDDAVASEEDKLQDPKGDTDDGVAKAEDSEKKAGVESLKALAKTAAENSEQSMVKEAQEFGKLFANAAMEEMQKIAQKQETYDSIVKEAYDVMQQELFISKLASIAGEAYELTQKALEGSSEEGSHDKTAEQDKGIETAKTIVKEAYDLTQQYLDSHSQTQK